MKGKQSQGKKDEERKEKGDGKQKERDGTQKWGEAGTEFIGSTVSTKRTKKQFM